MRKKARKLARKGHCNVCWGSHGCRKQKGHIGRCLCQPGCPHPVLYQTWVIAG